MDKAMIQTVLFSLIRHLLSLLGGVMLVENHESEIQVLAGALVAIAPVIFSAIKSRREARQKEILAGQLEILKAKPITTGE